MTTRPGRTATWKLALLLFVGIATAVLAATGDATLEITFDRAGTTRPFRYLTAVDRWDALEIQSDPGTKLRPYLREAREELARELGYDEATHGPRYYLIPRAGGFSFRVVETRSGRVIAQSTR